MLIQLIKLISQERTYEKECVREAPSNPEKECKRQSVCQTHALNERETKRERRKGVDRNIERNIIEL